MDEKLIRRMIEVDERHWWYRGRRRILEVELSRLPLPQPATVLDAGCGSGRTMQELERFGTVNGIELNEEAAAFARSRGHGDVQIGRVESLPWADETFDLITCLDVLEHTPDDRVALAELLRVTKPGGWLVVTVPAYPSLWSAHDEINHHHRRYRRQMLRAAGRGAGWSIERMTGFNSLLLAPAAVVRMAERRRSVEVADDGDLTLHLAPGWVNNLLERPLRAEAKWLARGRTLPAGLSLLAVMRRPAVPAPIAGERARLGEPVAGTA